MPLIAKEQSKESILAPSGLHRAVCIQVVDLGTQADNYLGNERAVHQVHFAWELVDELMPPNENGEQRPFVISKKYNLYFGEKANLRKDLESWRGRPFTQDELKGFDLVNVLGKECSINILHQHNPNTAKTYAKIAAISPKMKGTAAANVHNQLLYFDMFGPADDPSWRPDWDVFRALPSWVQENIKKSPEFEGWIAEATPDNTNNVAYTAAHEEDIPF